jgi:hypothetical protein
MAEHRKRKKFIGIAAGVGLLMAAAFGGYSAANSNSPETVNLAGAQASTPGQSITLHACLISGKLTQVSQTAPNCPANSVPVQWAVQPEPSASSTNPSPTATTPSSDPTGATSDPTSPASGATTAPATTPASSATTASSSGSVCVKTTNDRCDYPAFAGIVGASSDPYVDQNIWAGDANYKQTLYATNPGNWYVTANANTNFGGVLTYPNTGFSMAGSVDSYSSVTSSYSTTIPTNARTAGWAAYDLWFNNWNDEVMIQTDITANSYYDCTATTTATFGGEPWHLCVFGSERVWKPGTDDQHLLNTTSGTIDIQSFLTWMEQHGYLPKGSTWTAASYGFEICDTGGANENFQVNSFSWTATK